MDATVTEADYCLLVYAFCERIIATTESIIFNSLFTPSKT